MRFRSLFLGLLVCVACGDDGGSDDSATGGVDSASTGSTDSTSTSAATTTTGTTGTSGTSDDTTTSSTTGTTEGTDGTDGGTAGTDGTSATGTTGDGGSTGTTGATADPFTEPQPFGDDVQELDLVGSWGLNWEPANGWDSVLEIDALGNFIWTEYSADCTTTTVGSGVVWTEGIQIVMHVDTWQRPLPWDTSPLGETFPPPFRMRMSFTLQGNGQSAYLALSGPDGLTQTESYDGQSYVQMNTSGTYLGGQWRGESELVAVPAGESQAVVIVRDVDEAFTDPEASVDDPQGVGTMARTRTFFPEPSQDIVYANFNWTCLDGCPMPSGTTFVAGTNLYTYGPYASYQHLMTFESGRAFQRGVTTDCR